MARYIDADVLMKVLETYKFGAISNEVERKYTKETVMSFVTDLHTVYEGDVVVARLEEILNLARASLKSEIEMSGECTTFIQERYRGHIEMLETAIDIVKQGGAE